MPYRNLNHHRGMLQSSHAPQTRPVARSSGNKLNPAAGNFNPQALATQKTLNSAQFSVPAVDTASNALVPHKEQQEDNHTVTVMASELRELTDIFNEEILSLRQDVEMLKQGGWCLTVGAWQPAKQVNLSEVEATRQRLQNSGGLLGALTSQSRFLSPASATRQFEGPPAPSDTLATAPNGTSSTTPAVRSPKQNQANDEYAAADTKPAIQAGLMQSKYATNGTTPNGTVNGSTPNDVQTQTEDLPKQLPKQLMSPPTHPDTPLPSTEDPSFAYMSSHGNWQPLAIRNLRPLPADVTSTIPAPPSTQTFSWDFLRSLLVGKWWSPGFYYHPVSEGASILPSRTYYLLDASNDPYVPRSPGAHGAKLTAFFNPENPADADGDEAAAAFDNVPVFVAASEWAARHDLAAAGTDESGGTRYVYMGMYSQLRFSDKLDYDRLVEHVPYAIKMYWADQLADVARPAWVTDALMKAFVPKPEYEGPLPGPAAEDDVVRKEVGRHVRDLKEWEREARRVVGRLTREKVFEAFGAEDAADPPGLRLWWEYLECVGWDSGFYEVLVREQEKWVEKQRRAVAPNGRA